jgi:hypothetical protein
MIQDVTSIQQSGETELAFVLTSSREEYDNAKRSASGSGSYGLISGSANWSDAKEKALRIAEATKFNSESSYASNYFAQQISGKAMDGYMKCLDSDKEVPGMHVWFDHRLGDYFTFKAFWVGADTSVGAASWQQEPFVDVGKVVSKPDTWTKGTTEEIVVKRSTNEDMFLQLKVGGKTGSAVVVKDPPVVVWLTKPVQSLKLLSVHSHNPTKKSCGAGVLSDCIYPSEPGGAFVPGSAHLADFSTSERVEYSEKKSPDTSGQICIEMSQSTSACENTQTATGRVAAVERYPHPATQ